MAINLIIDIGNTRTKFALFNEQTLLFKTAGDLNTFNDLLEQHEIEKAIVSSVSKDQNIVEQLISKEISFISLSHQTPIPVDNQYETPETLGDDRLANVIGNQFLFPKSNVLAVDIGTCIKYDLVTSAGTYFGGGISPGVNMRFTALNQQTHQLPQVEVEDINYLIGTSSKKAIRSGVINGCVAEIDGIVQKYHGLYDNLTVILTGGGAEYFQKMLTCDFIYEPNLTLIGLNEILRYQDK